MTPQQDAQGRAYQLGKLKARIEATGLLAKLDGKTRPLTVALYLGGAEKASLALRLQRQSREPYWAVEVVTIDRQDTARVISRVNTNSLDALAIELVQAAGDLLRKPADADVEAA